MRGLNRDEFAAFAAENHLVAVGRAVRAVPGGQWTAQDLEIGLRRHGPLWCAFNYGHIVTVVGADAATGTVTVHNPQGGPNEVFPIVNFNRLIINHPLALLGLDPARVGPAHQSPYT